MDNYETIKRIKKISIITIISIIVGIIIFLIARTIYFSINSSTIELLIAPSSANILINGKTYHNGTYHLPPAEYKIELSMDGFMSKTINTTTIKGQTSHIYNYLTESEGTDWYANHPDDAEMLNVIMPELSYQKNLALRESHPILKQLPLEINYYPNNYTYIHYVISYTIDDNDNITFVIHDYTGGNYDAAINKLTSRGVNIDNYKIIYNDESDQSINSRAD